MRGGESVKSEVRERETRMCTAASLWPCCSSSPCPSEAFPPRRRRRRRRRRQRQRRGRAAQKPADVRVQPAALLLAFRRHIGPRRTSCRGRRRARPPHRGRWRGRSRPPAGYRAPTSPIPIPTTAFASRTTIDRPTQPRRRAPQIAHQKPVGWRHRRSRDGSNRIAQTPSNGQSQRSNNRPRPLFFVTYCICLLARTESARAKQASHPT